MILSASDTASVSMARVLLRIAHCLSKPMQVSFRLRRNFMSEERCSRVSAKFSFFRERLLIACVGPLQSIQLLLGGGDLLAFGGRCGLEVGFRFRFFLLLGRQVRFKLL